MNDKTRQWIEHSTGKNLLAKNTAGNIPENTSAGMQVYR
jgi:hypothetical protein